MCKKKSVSNFWVYPAEQIKSLMRFNLAAYRQILQ